MWYIYNAAKVKQGYTVYLWSENFYQENYKKNLQIFA
jgi:hypothetical protein